MNLTDLLQSNPSPEPMFEFRAGKFQYSASQVDTFRDCPRKWAYKKIFRISEPPHPSAELGSRVHALREEWLRHGTMPEGDSKEANLARAGMEHLPMPGTCDVELKFQLETETGVIIGYKDFFIPDQGAVGYYPPELTESRSYPDTAGVPLVGDHKTTSNERFIKSPDVLSGWDSQAAIYAQAARERLNNNTPQGVDLFWHYMVKKSRPVAVPVRARMTNGQIDDSFGRVLEDSRKMLSIFDTQGISPEDIEPNPQTCDSYGGCPYRDRCPLSNDQRMIALTRSIGGESNMTTLADKLRELVDEKNNGAANSNGASASSAPVLPNIANLTTGTSEENEVPASLAALKNKVSSAPVQMPSPAVVSTPAPSAPAAPAGLPAALASAVVANPEAQAAALAQPPPQAAEAESPAAPAAPAVATLPDAEQGVVPPDAPEADLQAKPETKKKAPRATKATKARRDQFVLEIFTAMLSAGATGLTSDIADKAIAYADILIEAIDKK